MLFNTPGLTASFLRAARPVFSAARAGSRSYISSRARTFTPGVAQPTRHITNVPFLRPNLHPPSLISRTRSSFILRTAQQQRHQSNYQTFHARSAVTANIFRRWARRPTFYYEVTGAAGVVFAVYLLNQEEVPVSGRRRLNLISAQSEEQMGRQQYRQTLAEYRGRILPASDPRTRQVQRVLQRLIPSSGLADKDWEVHVIDSPDEANAFVIPGGKVFVFTGILPMCADDNGLAAVLGHEIAHNVAHHAAERMTSAYLLIGAIYALEIFGLAPASISQVILDLVFGRPGSRRQESEADVIGLLMMAESCFDPRAAVQMWRRMENYEASHGTVPQVLSTHPSSHNRQVHLQEVMPRALGKLEEAGCGRTAERYEDFRHGGWAQGVRG